MCRCRKQQSGLFRLARSLGPYRFGILTRRMAPPVPKRPSGKKFDVEKLLENDYSATVWIGQSNNCSKDQDNKSAKRKCEDETPLCLLVLRSSDPSLGQNQVGGPHNLPKENELGTHSDCCSLDNIGVLLFNVFFGVLVTYSTGFVFLSLLRRKRNPFQLKLESLLILLSVVSVLCAVYKARIAIDSAFGTSAVQSFFRLPHHLQVPLSVGLGCVVGSCIWLVLRIFDTLFQRSPAKPRQRSEV
jgi:hypothetical protein